MSKWLSSLLGKRAGAAPAPVGPPYQPYAGDAGSAANFMYNLLFCDDPEAFLPKTDQVPAPHVSVLFGDSPDIGALTALANDTSREGRIRYLAFGRLRSLGHAVPPRQLLGVVAEVHLQGGLDVLAAFSEGGVRYINHTATLCVVEGIASTRPLSDALLAAALPALQAIGPWKSARRPPPQAGWIRLSFLTSDGLCFGEGPGEHFQKDPLAAPVIHRAGLLLKAVTELRK